MLYLTLIVIFFAVVLIIIQLRKADRKVEPIQAQPQSRKRDKEATHKKRAYYSVQFSYMASDGAISNRVVHVTSGRRGERFKGYCCLRNEVRSFRFDRIENDEVINVDTGELMTAREWQQLLQAKKRS